MGEINRPPATGGMRHVALNVEDMAACEQFYVGLLGMRVEWRPDPDNLYLTSGCDNLALHRAAGAPAAAGAAAEEEQTEFELVLKEVGAKKINVIKAVREVTSLGLKEAKDLVDGAPKTVKDGMTKDEAEEVKKKFEAEGAKVEIK